ncbi:thioredoxin-related transmembrane protein 1 [Formica exsecta]|uniref:thioredoxin-related transmembrane protein 1 n=1 Tax=Formica exsecta TaxID=72781 RepID=UPI00114502D4|nr:thioredoxin-related transmembrane protein 1 [Formica exsecta]
MEDMEKWLKELVVEAIHNKLLEDIGLPTWGSYLIFAVATIILGAILGLLIVCLIDFIYPPKPAQQQNKKKQNILDGSMQERSLDEDEITENVGDDLVDEEESEAEEPEKIESEIKELEVSEKDKDTKTDTSSPNVRKRKPRKAD